MLLSQTDKKSRLIVIKKRDIMAQRKQKDWIIYNPDVSNLFCIAIESDDGGNTWRLIEFVNFFGQPTVEGVKKITNGYSTMIDAAREKGSGYEYIIAGHDFDKSAVDTPYWHSLIPDDKFWGMAEVEVPIDKDEFESEMAKLVKDIKYRSKR